MADIIPLNDKRQRVEQKRAACDRRRKIRAVQKVFQCSRCALKCEKCGAQLECGCQAPPSAQTGHAFHLCEGCGEEYQAYLRCQQGDGDPACYWHNAAWLATWKHWLDYQRARQDYINSPEFVRLIEELRQIGPHE
ncbi:MAG: hypothetical protein LJE63_00710 [Desulfobacteraceae bacterium]|nr:hypothetical protein [Desulfobacteraceae bacterium]